MHVKKQIALLAIGMVTVFGVMAGAQAAKPMAKARVFFVEPKDGATVTSPLHMKFGSSGIEIGAVPAGDVTTARPGIAHYHVGIDQTCLPAGKNIVKGTPSWVHFGDGKSEFDSQLAPGKHKLALQLGDDLHSTLPGACQVITVTVK
ncbi:MAG: hypothetical protein A3F69_02720 [Acidobacteria bacterium RIFCSPLOWO2_12_FULL_66_10]|nr:MAG: hypothetical protein A3F69_02720 [Acidobacteria bacterium RIFCSPLOWO2_12_FULL_66_10]